VLDVQDDRPVPALAERYELGDVLGAGGTATVYRAFDRGSGRQVAVKLFDQQVSRYSRQVVEAAALGELHHPGLVELYAAGSENGQAYLVMQLIDGETLAEQIARGPLPVTAVVAMGACLADTLAHVHEQGVVHRDLKPGNVLLDAEQRPYLTDFGVSRLIDATRVTATGFVVGTPAYMAPEQVRGATVGPPADVYALGLILLEALTGHREYPGDVVESAVARLHRRPALPAQLPAALQSLLSAMTADDPVLRPDAGAVAVRLTGMQAAAGTRPPVIGPASSMCRPSRSRVRSMWLGVAAASAAVVTGALVMVTAADPPPSPAAAARGPAPAAVVHGPTPLPAAPAEPVVVQPLAAPQPAAPPPRTATTIAAPRPVTVEADAARSHGERTGDARVGPAASADQATFDGADRGGRAEGSDRAEQRDDNRGNAKGKGGAKGHGNGDGNGNGNGNGNGKNGTNK
jgi:eukaryotic-like serine/threonine-protein kinase